MCHFKFGIGLGVYTFFTGGGDGGGVQYGGWWAMIAVFLFAGLGASSANR